MLIDSSQAAIDPAGDQRRAPPGAHGSTMSIANAENLVRIARDQISQRDINESLLKAVAELTREIKRLDDDVRRARREIQLGRRF